MYVVFSLKVGGVEAGKLIWWGQGVVAVRRLSGSGSGAVRRYLVGVGERRSDACQGRLCVGCALVVEIVKLVGA